MDHHHHQQQQQKKQQQQQEQSRIWENLKSCVVACGGQVHPALQLQWLDSDRVSMDVHNENIDENSNDNNTTLQTPNNSNLSYRGVIATAPIRLGDVLIHLPSDCAIDGRRMPDTYYVTGAEDEEVKAGVTAAAAAAADDAENSKRNDGAKSRTKASASPWLRCLAALYKHCGGLVDSATCGTNVVSSSTITTSTTTFHGAYRASLPRQMETVWVWTDDELRHYLSGTSCPGGGQWHDDPSTVRERYDMAVRPYLKAQNIPLPETIEEEYDQFTIACQLMSTRCFHLASSTSTAALVSSPSSLLLDAPTSGGATSAASVSTTIKGNDNAMMLVEKGGDHTMDVDRGYTGPFFLPMIDLLNHSSSLNVCTTLQRQHNNDFTMIAERPIQAGEEIVHSYGTTLTASQFLHTFGFVPEESARQHTSAVLEKQTVLDACYQVMRSDYPTKIASVMQEMDVEDEVWDMPTDKREASFLPEAFVVSESDPLPNELVTCLCLPFLPKCAYREAAQALLDHSVLEDYFLGKLVCGALLKALEMKLAMYEPIQLEGVVYDDDNALLTKIEQEFHLLPENLQRTRRRLKYGLLVRLGEKTALQAARREAVRILTELDADMDDSDSAVDASKRQRHV